MVQEKKSEKKVKKHNKTQQTTRKIKQHHLDLQYKKVIITQEENRRGDMEKGVG